MSVTPLRTLPNRAAVTARLKADGFDPATDRYGVRTYRLVYRTVDAKGRRPPPAACSPCRSKHRAT